MGMLCVDRELLKTLRFILMWAVIVFLPQPQRGLEKKNPAACSPFIHCICDVSEIYSILLKGLI